MGYPIVGMAYPCGGVNNDDRVAALIREHTGVKYCRTITSSESFAPQENLYRFNPTVSHLCGWDHLMETARRFVEADPTDRPLLYVWGHSFEMDLATENWQRLDEFFAYISGRDDVFYGTNREVLLG